MAVIYMFYFWDMAMCVVSQVGTMLQENLLFLTSTQQTEATCFSTTSLHRVTTQTTTIPILRKMIFPRHINNGTEFCN
jgi:hypothetical protein